ncbi:uncharacterized protein TrAtP1_000542 [Trichoderma atroviride]|uniref:uncharacterized protein n=1 Tax=Hypocrea atroviridis TaxID=63577 RepID=UPI003324F22A|nr:hypothetical protein TrAtP1_000542 [Trichoderma atroviride]
MHMDCVRQYATVHGDYQFSLAAICHINEDGSEHGVPPLHLGLAGPFRPWRGQYLPRLLRGRRACLALIQTKLLALDTVTAVSDLGGATLAKASSASEHTINSLLRDVRLCVSWDT